MFLNCTGPSFCGPKFPGTTSITWNLCCTATAGLNVKNVLQGLHKPVCILVISINFGEMTAIFF